MTRAGRVAFDAVTRFLPHLALAVFVAAGLTWLCLNWFARNTPSRLSVGLVLFVIYLASTIVVLGVYLLRRENFRLKQSAYDLHAVNHIYRNALSQLFLAQSKVPVDSEHLLNVEREVLCAVCLKVAHIFTNLIGRSCVVTTKLLAEENDEQFCFTWARSDREIHRDDFAVERYVVGKKVNTAFDEALKLRPSGPSYFYSADLIALKKKRLYENRREGWENLYRSTIVVPIRYVQRVDKKTDVIGFLCVDTLSRNRLNATYHVELLSAFADQMYNFLSIMRHRFLFDVTQGQDAQRT